jgi:hypothetical protein
MAIHFAAVHARKPWRKHSIHKTLFAAISGPDGARNLLRRIGRVGRKWDEYGDVKCVFVWDDEGSTAHALRLNKDGAGAIEEAIISVDAVLRFNKSRQCTDADIDSCFRFPHAQPTDTELAPLLPPAPGGGAHPEPSTEFRFAEELPAAESYPEGLPQTIQVNRYERSTAAREACIAHYGAKCLVCSLDFRDRYGPLGSGYIHVHHRRPLSSIDSRYEVDPIRDLVPVCPNCHAMLHRDDPPLEVETLRKLLSDG